MDTETSAEIWQVETGGQIYDTNFDEMTAWINEGTLLRIDRVRKGNLRWIEAGKVPQLAEFFNAVDTNGPTVTVSSGERRSGIDRRTSPGYRRQNAGRRATDDPDFVEMAEEDASQMCSVHPDVEAALCCETCGNLFCKACPNSYGGTVKICPFCGAMCSSLAQKRQEELTRQYITESVGEGFGFGDFGRALAYPFKFKTSLIFGAILFTFFSLGQGAMAFGGIFMMASAIFCVMLANMLTFGVLSNTVENFAQGKLDQNFMPSFDDFSIWDDVVHPFFLSIGVYISSFGPFIAVILVAVFMVVGAVRSEMNGLQSDGARVISPQIPYAANTAGQAGKLRETVNSAREYQQLRAEQLENGEIDEKQLAELNRQHAAEEEEYFERTNQMIQEHRKAQLESAVGKTPETVAKERDVLFKQILGYGALFLILAGITFLWGLFYFPAACAVAGYTRSFAATLNPAVGLDTIRRLGSTYALILVMSVLLIVASMVVSGVLALIFLPFDMPGVGNLPAKAIGSLFGFYLSVVFACVIGYAMYKSADRLAL